VQKLPCILVKYVGLQRCISLFFVCPWARLMAINFILSNQCEVRVGACCGTNKHLFCVVENRMV